MPALFLEDQAVDLVVPVDVERLALRIVVGAGQPDERGLAGGGGRDHLLHQPSP
ncbi:MAG TPA: hypothetical protein VMM35_09115 [Longimicrobiales bacterium]|nr:hypothetical protein [Longimicrobiales bacterium]